MGAIMSCCAMNAFECAACAACSCFTKFLDWTMSQAARFAHSLIMFILFTIAIVLGSYYTDDLQQYASSNINADCAAGYEDQCIYRQLIYRASLSLFVLFVILAVFSSISDRANKDFWAGKLFGAVGLFIAFWWADNSHFKVWAEISRFVSFFWLLVQGLLLLDFAHDVHIVLLTRADETEKSGDDSRIVYGSYLVLAAGSLAAAIVGLVYLFQDYFDCGLGQFFTLFTVILGFFTTVISLLNSVNRGLLTPCIMFAYSVFMCWYALLSYPDTTCNPTANETNGGLTAIIVIAVVSVVVVFYCVFNGTKILNIFNPDGEGVIQSYDNTKSKELESVLTGENAPAPTTSANIDRASADKDDDDNDDKMSQPSGTPHERVFFHVLMAMFSCYAAMVLTSWNDSYGNTAESSSNAVEYTSMWLKIVSQWVFLILYLRVLQVAYNDNLIDASNV